MSKYSQRIIQLQSYYQVIDIEDKGKGVRAKVQFQTGQYVCEYGGETLSYEKALQKEKQYLSKQETYKGYM